MDFKHPLILQLNKRLNDLFPKWRKFYSIPQKERSTDISCISLDKNELEVADYVFSHWLSHLHWDGIYHELIDGPLNKLTSIDLKIQVKAQNGTQSLMDIQTNAPEKLETLMHLLHCIFPGGEAFQRTDIYTIGGRFSPDTRKRKNMRRFVRWTFTESAYLNLIDVFPQWKIQMFPNWFSEAKKKLLEYLINDLANICFVFLDFKTNFQFQDLHEIDKYGNKQTLRPEKHITFSY